MVIMAGMLPGVESARRRRVRQSSSGAADAGGLARGRDLGSSSSSAASSKVWSGVCRETTAMARAWTTTLGSDTREAKERLDHKLRSQRQLVFKRHEMSTRPPPAKPHDDGRHSATTTYGVVLEREVLSSPSSRPKKGGGGCRRLAGRRCVPPAAEAEAECAVCLEELRAGDVVARLPCSHRFHWSCAVPWVQAVSQCPSAAPTSPLAPADRPGDAFALLLPRRFLPPAPRWDGSDKREAGHHGARRAWDDACFVSREGRHTRMVRWLVAVAF